MSGGRSNDVGRPLFIQWNPEAFCWRRKLSCFIFPTCLKCNCPIFKLKWSNPLSASSISPRLWRAWWSASAFSKPLRSSRRRWGEMFLLHGSLEGSWRHFGRLRLQKSARDCMMVASSKHIRTATLLPLHLHSSGFISLDAAAFPPWRMQARNTFQKYLPDTLQSSTGRGMNLLSSSSFCLLQFSRHQGGNTHKIF